MRKTKIISAYKRYAPIYDILFGAVFNQGRVEAIGQLQALSPREVLEIGVGTGLSLSLYHPETRVTGIDLSHEMLRVANRKGRGRANKARLCRMNAEQLAFTDQAFDAVCILFVISVTPNPAALLHEARRVLKPGGHLLIVNYFALNESRSSRRNGLVERFSELIGFRPWFPIEVVTEQPGIRVLSVKRLGLLGSCTLVHAIGDSEIVEKAAVR